MFFFALLCLSGRPHRVTLIFKNTKNSFLSFLVSVRPLASYDTYFQVIQKNTKKYKILKIQISTFSNKYFLQELHNPDFSSLMRIRRTKVNPCRAQKIKKKLFFFSFLEFLSYYFFFLGEN